MPVFEAFRLALQTIRAQKLKSGFSLLGVFIGVASLIAAWSIVNGVNRYMTEKFAQTLYGVNTFQLRRRPMFTPNVPDSVWRAWRSEEHTSELQSQSNLVCRLLLEKKKKTSRA